MGQWIHEIALRDDQALKSLYSATAPRVAANALRLLRRHDLVEEVVGDTFWQVWRDAARYSAERGAPINWLLAIARSRAIDAIRRQSIVRRHEVPFDDDEGDALPCQADGYCLETVDRDARLLQMLRCAEPVHRQLLSLAFFDGLSHQEIAAHCGLPLGTVKSHVRRGLLALRTACVGAGLAPRLG